MSSSLFAADLPKVDQQQQHMQTQQQAREEQLTPQAPDIHQAPVADDADGPFPKESPCFVIKRVELTGQEAFPFWFSAQRIVDAGVGHCLGARGINQLMRRLQNRLMAHGWITSRVLAPPQDLSRGTLKLRLVPGILRHIRYADNQGAWASLSAAMPGLEGKLLDLRAIEQGLENLQQIPTVEAKMEIVPGDQPGESDVLITRRQSKRWRINAWVDNSGTRSTGRGQGGIMLALDNPLGLSDLFYVTASHDLGFHGYKRTKNISANYTVPVGYWQWNVTGGQYSYVQNVAGYNGDIRYSGKTKNLNTALSRVLQRNAYGKTSASFGLSLKEIRYYLDHDEIHVQRRRTTALLFGLDHRHYLGQATLDIGLNYQHGVRWLGARPAYEVHDEPGYRATDKTRTLSLSSTLNWPFALGQQHFRYQTSYFYQYSHRPLTSPDQLAIGNQWTVRGFDGERTLSASRGFYIQNTLAWVTPIPGQELYIGADYGQVHGHSDGSTLLGHHLAGSVLGLRGNVAPAHISYDAFFGTPIVKPKGFRTDSVSFNFSVNWQY